MNDKPSLLEFIKDNVELKELQEIAAILQIELDHTAETTYSLTVKSLLLQTINRKKKVELESLLKHKRPKLDWSLYNFDKHLVSTPVKMLAKRFNLAELKEIVFDLSMDWEELEGGEVKNPKILSLLKEVNHLGKTQALIKKLFEVRKKIDWHIYDFSWKQFSTQIFNVPRLEKHYIERDLTVELKHKLSVPGTIYSLYGLAGVGKSSLAKALGYELRSEYEDGVLWLDLTEAVDEKGNVNKGGLLEILNTFEALLGISNLDQNIENRSGVLRNILNHKRFLIILNNAYGQNDIKLFNLTESSLSSVLITTRNSSILDQKYSKELLSFPQKTSRKFLESLLSKKIAEAELQSANNIIDFVGGLPLAIRIIGDAIRKSRTLTLYKYEKKLKTESKRLEHLKPRNNWDDRSKNVRAAFEISYNYLPLTSKKLFLSMGLFASSDFGIDDLVSINQHLNDADEAIDDLIDLSLVNEDRDGHRINLHALVRTFIKEKLALGLSKTQSLVQAEIPLQAEQDKLIQSGVDYYTGKFILDHKKDFNKINCDWANIQFSLNELKARKKWKDFFLAFNNLTLIDLGIMGYLDVYGLWDEAIEYLEDLVQSKMADTHSDINKKTLLLMGGFKLRQGNLKQAESYLTDFIDIFADKDTNELSLLKSYACGYLSEIKLNQAPTESIDWAQKGINFLNEISGEKYAQEQTYLKIKLGTAQARCGYLEEARKIFVETQNITLNKKTNAESSWLLTYGIITYREGNLTESESVFRNGIELAKDLGNIRHIAHFYRNLSIVLETKGEMSCAIEDSQIALATYRSLSNNAGQGAIEVAEAETHLSMMYMFVREFNKAKPLWENALSISEDSNLDYLKAAALVAKGRWHFEMAEFEQAQTCLKRVLALEEDEVYDLYPEIYRLQAYIALSENNILAAHESIHMAIQTTEPMDILNKSNNLRVQGDILSFEKHFEKAKCAYETSLMNLEQINRDSFHIARTKFALAQHFLREKSFTKACELLKDILKMYEVDEATFFYEEVKNLLDDIDDLNESCPVND